MEHSEPSKYPEKGKTFVNNFDDHDDSNDKVTSGTDNEEATGLNDNRSDVRQSDVQIVPVSEHTPEQFISVLHNEIEELKNDKSVLLQMLESVNEEKSTLKADNVETVRILENQIKTKDEENEKLKIKFESVDEELRETIASHAMKASRYSEIEREKQTLQNECDVQKKIVNELSEKNKQKDNDLSRREDRIKKLEEQCETDKKTCLDRTNRQRTFITTYKEEIKGLKKELDRLQQFEIVHPALKDQLAQYERRKFETDKKMEQAENEIKQLREEIRAIGEEKQHLILRLSKLTGAKLTLDNPNITDLSDGKRPTKLAEEFAELYDNGWTDAFEDMKIDDERARISFMLKLLMRAHALCQEVSGDHMNRIKTNICKLKLCVKDHSGKEQQKQPRQEEKQAVMSISGEENSSSCANTMNQRSPRKDHEPHGPSMVASQGTDIEQRETTENDAIDAYEVTAKAENFSDGDTSAQSNIEDIPDIVIDFNSLPHDEKKTIKELRKFIEIRMSDKLEAIATDVIAREYCIDNKTQNTVLDYIRKCVNICWSMCRIDPPVSISFPDVHGDMKLDTSAYKPYTKSGKIIDFIVWPVLYLHEGGPLLSKGVAQGRN